MRLHLFAVLWTFHRSLAHAFPAVSMSPPWLARVERIKADAVANVEAEHKLKKLSEEARELARELKKRVSSPMLRTMGPSSLRKC